MSISKTFAPVRRLFGGKNKDSTLYRIERYLINLQLLPLLDLIAPGFSFSALQINCSRIDAKFSLGESIIHKNLPHENLKTTLL